MGWYAVKETNQPTKQPTKHFYIVAKQISSLTKNEDG